MLDATEAVKSIRLVRNIERTAGKAIPAAILFTRTSAAIRPRSLQAIEAEFASSRIKVLETQMHERDAFRAIFSFGGSLTDLDRGQVGNVVAAIANARAFARGRRHRRSRRSMRSPIGRDGLWAKRSSAPFRPPA